MNTKTLTHIALMTAVLCVLAPISIPVGTVALTPATFVIYLMAFLLHPKQALTATGLYLLLGTIGLPVFSGYMAGISRFTAPGGGYLMGYLFLAGISSFAIHHFSQPIMQMLGMVFATLVMYALGTFWLAQTTGSSFLSALPAGTLIFLPLDILKLLLSFSVGRKLQNHLKQI